MELTEQQNKIFDFVKLKHGEQKRKYTNEPYYNHLFNVATIVSQYEEGCIEIALCHDVFEDTKCNFDELYKLMISIGYNASFAYNVCTYVKELTDKYTKEEYPYHNRWKRKQLECERLSKISYHAQTVKYADLIDNTSSIVQYDSIFAATYLKEKEDILSVMFNGNSTLYNVCKNTLLKAQSYSIVK